MHRSNFPKRLPPRNFAETSRKNKTTCFLEHPKEKHFSMTTAPRMCKSSNPKMRSYSVVEQNLIKIPECAKTYIDDNVRTIRQARLPFHLSVLESVYIKTQYPVLCKQKEFIFSLRLLK